MHSLSAGAICPNQQPQPILYHEKYCNIHVYILRLDRFIESNTYAIL